MTDKDYVVKHLDIIQAIVSRMANNSIVLKVLSVVLVTATLFLPKNPFFLVTSTVGVLIIGLWILDGFFLWQERIFRGIYNDVRQQKTTDFSMNVPAQLKKPECSWIGATFSKTISLFYALEIWGILSLIIYNSLFG